jgi:hypothetical protein
MILDPGQELGALWVECLWDPLRLKVNPLSSPQYLVTLALSVKPIQLGMRADQLDALSMGWQISGSVR